MDNYSYKDKSHYNSDCNSKLINQLNNNWLVQFLKKKTRSWFKLKHENQRLITEINFIDNTVTT